MKIAFFHELQSGGARRSVIEFGKQLKKNHTVDLYYIDTKSNKKEEEQFDKSFFYAFRPKHWAGKNWKAKLYKDTIELYTLYKLHKKIANIINNKIYDFVFVEPSRYTQAPFILRFLSTNTIYYCQEALRMIYDPVLNSIDNLYFTRKVYELISRALRKYIDKSNIYHATVIFSNSVFSRKNIKKAYGLKSTVCYMGVDTNVFKPLNKKRDIDILYVGAYDYVDGYDLFSKSIEYFPQKPKIMILAREKQWITSDMQLRNIYNRAKVTVCISYNEPFGLIPLESMACGAPVIALNQGGYKESIIHDKTGLLVEEDPQEFANAIKNLLKHEKKRLEMSHRGRTEMVSNWQWSKGVKSIEHYGKQKN